MPGFEQKFVGTYITNAVIVVTIVMTTGAQSRCNDDLVTHEIWWTMRSENGKQHCGVLLTREQICLRVH